MPNWCSNTVTFCGDVEAIKQVQELFESMKSLQDSTGNGQLPDFLHNEQGYFFDLYWNEGEEGMIQYETRWSPNTEIVQAIADRYKVGFQHEYAETGCMVYGRATYENGVLDDISLDWDDFDAYYYDEDTECYYFEEETYESDYEILDILLQRRVTGTNKYSTL